MIVCSKHSLYFCCYLFLDSHTKIKKNTKKKYSEEIQEIIGARKVCFNAEK